MSEDRFEWSPAWRRRVLPRRGGVRVAPPDPAPEADASALARRGNRVRVALERPGHEPDVVEAGLDAVAVVTLSADAGGAASDGGAGGASDGGAAVAADGGAGAGPMPFGVAVAVLASLAGVTDAERDDISGVADLLVARHGPVFAAQTVAELGGLWVGAPPGRAPVIRRRTDADGPAEAPPTWAGFAGHVRRHLGVVSDDVHRRVVDALAPYRRGVLLQRAATSFLVPDRTDWVDADVALTGRRAAGEGWLLLHAVRDAEQARSLAHDLPPLALVGRPEVVATLLDGVGPAAAPILDGWVDHVGSDPTTVRLLLSALARVPTDDAYRALVARSGDPAGHAGVADATRRFPHRALRLIAAGSQEKRFATLLRDLVLTRPEVVDRVLPTLPAEAAQRVQRIRDGAATVVVEPGALPAVLVRPPWTVVAARPEPVVVSGLAAAPENAMDWRPGEREEWLARRNGIATGFDGATMPPVQQTLTLLAWGPYDVAGRLLADWKRLYVSESERFVSIVVARFGVDVLWFVRERADEYPSAFARYLLPYASSELAPMMAGWYARRRAGRDAAVEWLGRHAAVAARALVPPALGDAGPARQDAEETLRMLAARGHDVTLREAAAGYGPAAADGIATLLDTDPLDVLPAKIPALPTWIDPRLLPPVRLRDGSGVLPADAVRHLCTMLAMSRLDAPYAGVALVRETCDAADLVWALFERWVPAGMPSRDNWVLPALGLVGDDETVRRLGPVIRSWPSGGGYPRAFVGIDVLRAIGTDVALMHLYGIAEKTRHNRIRDHARKRIAEVAAGRGLTLTELDDRVVPDFGLDRTGGLVLDFGPRSFGVGFDEQLRPYLVDDSGRRRAALPKPGVKDDHGLASAAVKRFAGLKKDVRTAAADQIRRLERAMVDGRRWPAADFRTHLAGHPLVRHLVRRLVWSTDAGETFRVAEDGTFADAADTVWTLPDDATVRPVHPVDLGAATKVWAEVFADYELLQPFPQLARETFALTGPERTASALLRWKGRVVHTGRLLALERRGWQWGDVREGGLRPWFERPLPGGTLMIMIDPGIPVLEPMGITEQRIDEVVIRWPGGDPWSSDGALTMGTLDGIAASELIRDLEEVVR